MIAADATLAVRPPDTAVLIVDEQVRWWLSHGVTANEAARALGATRGGWECVRRRMEAWLVARGTT